MAARLPPTHLTASRLQADCVGSKKLISKRLKLPWAQMNPVEWSDKRLRRVLNTAVASVVTGDMIRAADFAVSTGYCGSLLRRTSSRFGARPPAVHFAAARLAAFQKE